MKKSLLLILIALIICSFSTIDEDSFLRHIVKNMVTQINMHTQEKVWLHTDRTVYNVKDRIWFRAFLVNATTHKRSRLSNYVYVEMVNRQDSVLQRIKLMRHDSVLFAGYMDIDEKIPQGEYFLRTYSYWMQNQGEDFIHKKKIKIINPESSRVLTKITYDKENNINLSFTNSRGEPYGKVFIEYQWKDGKNLGKVHIGQTNAEGELQMKTDGEINPQDVFVRFMRHEPFKFERYVNLPQKDDDFDLMFFPEGGALIPGNNQSIAYKAIGKDGLGVSVNGVIYDNQENMAGIIQTFHKGMGVISMKVEEGKSYHLLAKTNTGTEKRFDLPSLNPSGVALSVRQRDTLLNYVVIQGPQTSLPDSLYLLGHIRGRVLFCYKIGTDDLSGSLLLHPVEEGILHLCLIDSKYQILSQRLCFVRGHNKPEITFSTDKNHYVSREKVDMDLSLLSDVPVTGSFSLAVTNDETDIRESETSNIESELLLKSDLRGHIEDPAFYFREVNRLTNRCLDLLMMTQGWTRFDVAKVASGQFEPEKYYIEIGQALSGKINNFWGKDAMEANLSILSSNGIIRSVEADTAGHFTVNGIRFPNGVSFFVQARSKKGRQNVEVILDEDEYTSPRISEPYERLTEKGDNPFFAQYGRDFYYDEGVKVYILDEAVVKRSQSQKMYSFYDHLATHNLDSARLASMADYDIRRVIEEIPGLAVMDTGITRYGQYLYILVNEQEWEFSEILTLQTIDLLSISLLEGVHSRVYFGNKAENGALILTMNPNFIAREKPRLNRKVVKPLGYQVPTAFYMPRYDVDSVVLAMRDTADNRITIYWNPDVRLDSSKPAKLTFFTADRVEHFRIILEGILNDGRICRKEKRINMRNIREQ